MIETTVEPIMSEGITITPKLPASEAAQILRKPGVPALVVIDENEDICGILTESDLVALVAEGNPSTPVGTIMSSPVITAEPETPIGLAADRMTDVGVKHLPVVADGTYQGLVSLESMAPFLSRSRLRVVWKGDPIHIDANDSSDPTEREPTVSEPQIPD
jgi:CBS domain-containing protein